MTFALTLLITTAMVFILHKHLKKRPAWFYVLTIFLTGLYLFANYVDDSIFRFSWLMIIIQRCAIALSLFALVMFAGVFPKGSRPRTVLYPLRRQLAIIGSLLAVGHIIVYANTYIPLLLAGEGRLDKNKALSITVSFVTALILAVLTGTSFGAVRRLMEPARWKRVQTLAYLFFLLIFVHLALFLAPAAAAGSGTVIVNIIMYVVLFGSYSVLRLRRALIERQTKAALTA